jgi:glycosyltransferase involved in cell wall biosynthesis
MNIAILSPNFPPESGACSSRIHALAEGLARAGHRVSVITALPNYPGGQIQKAYRKKCFTVESKPLFSVRRYWLWASNSARFLPRILSMISFSMTVFGALPHLFRFKTDCILVQSPPLLLPISAYWLSKILNIKLIVNISDLWPQVLRDLSLLSSGPVLFFLEKIEQFIYRKADLCLGQSQEIIEHIRLKSPKTPLYLYRSGSDTTLFRRKEPIVFQKNGLLQIVYAGLIGMAQGLDELCKNINFKELEAELHIYGEGAERKKLEHKKPELAQKSIFLHPMMETERMPDILHQYDAALVVQKVHIKGTVPAKIYESMAAALPILFCGAGEGAQIVLENKAGLVAKPADYEQLKKNIIELKNMNPSQYEQMARQSSDRAKELYDRKNQLEGLLKYLEKIGENSVLLASTEI